MKDKMGVLAFISLIVTVLGVILPIAWDYYTGQKGVSLTLMSHSQLISTSAGVDGINITYNGTKLTSLSKMIFLLENTGNKPILKSDVITPVRITVPKDSNILDAIVDSKHPDNLDTLLKFKERNLDVDFSLLNPGDKIYISLLLDSLKSDFVATARIAGVNELNVNNSPPKTWTIWDLVWFLVGFLSLLLIIVSFIGFASYPKEFRTKRAIKNGSLIVPDFVSYKEAHDWVVNTTSFITSSERKTIINLLRFFEESNAKVDKDSILKTMNDAVHDSTNNLVVALIVFAVGVFGLYYSLNSMGFI